MLWYQLAKTEPTNLSYFSVIKFSRRRLFLSYLTGETYLTPTRQIYQYGRPFRPNSFTLTSSYLEVLPTSFNLTTCRFHWQDLLGKFELDNLLILQLTLNLTKNLLVWQLQQVLLGLTCLNSLVLVRKLQKMFLSLKI